MKKEFVTFVEGKSNLLEILLALKEEGKSTECENLLIELLQKEGEYSQDPDRFNARALYALAEELNEQSVYIRVLAEELEMIGFTPVRLFSELDRCFRD